MSPGDGPVDVGERRGGRRSSTERQAHGRLDALADVLAELSAPVGRGPAGVDRVNAPEHLVVEVFAAVRGRWLGGHLDDGRARDVLAALSEAALDLVATAALLPRMWELRDNLIGYDAASVAVAEAVGGPLVTCDARLVRAPGLSCEVRPGLPAT